MILFSGVIGAFLCLIANVYVPSVNQWLLHVGWFLFQLNNQDSVYQFLIKIWYSHNLMSENRSFYKIVIGDFNVKVGGHLQGDGAVVGQYGYGERNEKGTRLVQFATSENLTISNTCFKKGKSKKWTWRSSNGLVKMRLTTS